MYLPQLNDVPRERQLIEVFGGYNHNLRISEGEFFDMKNLSSTFYPVISPRAKRGLYKADTSPLVMVAKDEIGYVEGQRFYYGNRMTEELGISEGASAEKSSIVSMGAYVIIITRDKEGNALNKIWVNTTDMSFGDIEASFDVHTLRYTMCDIDGNKYNTPEPTSPVPPYKPAQGSVWVEPAEPYDVLQYDTVKGWQPIKTYIKLLEENIGAEYEVGDDVEIRLKNYSFAQAQPSLFGLKTIVKRDKNYIIFEGFLVGGSEGTINTQESPAINISRTMPNVDFVIESGNRLWGCRYGQNKDGKLVNEIYASKLGDFKNWKSFQGISTDSYAVSVGTDGAFTGAITYLGYPMFFKERHIHKVYGNMPSNYQMQVTECRGVQEGSSKSLAIVNELLYYKAQDGICVYDGSFPTKISEAFGNLTYKNAIAGVLGNKYYVSMQSIEKSRLMSPVYELFVFDSSTKQWHKEDNIHITDFDTFNGNLYYIEKYMDSEGNEHTRICTILCDGLEEVERSVKWFAETGEIGLSNPDNKYIAKVNIRASLSYSSRVNVYIRYDSMGDWIFVGKLMGAILSTHNLPIIPKRCDHFQLKFEGNGDAKIYSICKTIEQGGEG